MKSANLFPVRYCVQGVMVGLDVFFFCGLVSVLVVFVIGFVLCRAYLVVLLMLMEGVQGLLYLWLVVLVVGCVVLIVVELFMYVLFITADVYMY